LEEEEDERLLYLFSIVVEINNFAAAAADEKFFAIVYSRRGGGNVFGIILDRRQWCRAEREFFLASGRERGAGKVQRERRDGGVRARNLAREERGEDAE
jgi:hypothetical protein